MSGRKYGETGSGSLGRTYPLIGVEMLRSEDVVVLDRSYTVASLTVGLAVEHVQVIMEHHAYFGLVPLELPLRRNRDAGSIFHAG